MDEFSALRQLSNAILEGWSLRETVDLCETIIGSPLRFTWHQDPDGGILSKHYPYDDWQAWKAYVVPGGRPSSDYLFFLSDTYVIQHGTKPFLFAPDGPVRRRRLLCLAISGGHRAGHLSIPEMSVPLEELDHHLIELCAKFIALCCQQPGQAEQSGVAREAMRRLLSGRDIAYAELSVLMGKRALPQEGRFQLLMIRAVGAEYRRDMQALLDQLCGWYGSDWALSDRDHAVILYEGDRPAPGANGMILEHFRQAHCCGCSSPIFHDILHARLWFRRISALIPFRRAGAGEIVDYLDWLDQGLFLETHIGPNDMEAFLPEDIKALWALDRRTGTEYIGTLRAYCDQGLSQARTAEALVVHPNTVAYRLKKVAAMGIDLQAPGKLVQTILGLRILGYIEDVTGSEKMKN